MQTLIRLCDACAGSVVVCCMRRLFSAPKYRSWLCQTANRSEKQIRTQAGHIHLKKINAFVLSYNITLQYSKTLRVPVHRHWYRLVPLVEPPSFSGPPSSVVNHQALLAPASTASASRRSRSCSSSTFRLMDV